MAPGVRAGFATVVVVAQLLVITHTTFIAHTLSAHGEIVESGSVAEATHAHDTASWCEEAFVFDLKLDAVCTVAKLSQAPVVSPTRLVLDVTAQVLSLSAVLRREACNPISVLCVSPKASPPVVG